MRGAPPTKGKSPDKGGLRLSTLRKRRHGSPDQERVFEDRRCCLTPRVAVSLGVLIFLVLLPQGYGASLRQRRALNLQLKNGVDPLSHQSSSQSFLSMGVLSNSDGESRKEDEESERGSEENEDKEDGERKEPKDSKHSKSKEDHQELTEASQCGMELKRHFRVVCSSPADPLPDQAKLFLNLICGNKDKIDEAFSTVIKGLNDLRSVTTPQNPPQGNAQAPMKLHDVVQKSAEEVNKMLEKCGHNLKNAGDHSRELGTLAISDNIIFLTSMSGLLRGVFENMTDEFSVRKATEKTAAAAA